MEHPLTTTRNTRKNVTKCL